MITILHRLPIWAFLLVTTTFEVAGDAFVRMAIYQHAGFVRAGLLIAGAAFLFVYGFALNLAPVEFGRVVGLYIATLLVVWQIGNFVAFRTLPSLPIFVGGALVVAGGLIMTYWQPDAVPSSPN